MSTPIATSPAGERFPVELICPKCGQPVVVGTPCAADVRPCAGDHAGMPRFLYGQDYWGETSSEKMRQLLAVAREISWRDALQRLLPDEPVTEHLLAPIRADFLHAMPWGSIRNVLDVGAGMGFMACDLAQYAKNVVALEAVPERAEFIQIRARQDGLPIFPIIASAMEMPFAPESFDLITLNGVFEYIGLWGEGDPRALQEKFLRSALRLLRPGGWLYVGIETRFSLAILLGARDHSGLAFTSLMPRWLADVYCRMRARPNYGAEVVTGRYRTYTYTPLQYERMFRAAGFEQVTVYGVYDGYNRQIAVYELGDACGRKAVLERIDPPASVAGRLRRAVENNRTIARHFEQEVVLFGRKGPQASARHDAPWAEALAPDRTVVQVNLPSKILGIICEGGVPQEVLEIEKRGCEEAGRRLEHAFEILTHMQMKSKGMTLPMRWPEPRGRLSVSGRSYRRYEYVAGESLSALLRPARYREGLVLPLIARAVDAYVRLCEWMSEQWPSQGADAWDTLAQRVRSTPMDEDIRARVLAAIGRAQHQSWKMSAIHGDFTAGNVIVGPANEFVLIDWEHFTPAYPVGAELVRFQQDVLIDSKRLSPSRRARLAAEVDLLVKSAFEKHGYGPEAYGDLQSLYIGHQILSLGGEQNTYPPLLQAYRRTMGATGPA